MYVQSTQKNILRNEHFMATKASLLHHHSKIKITTKSFKIEIESFKFHALVKSLHQGIERPQSLMDRQIQFLYGPFYHTIWTI